MSWLKRCSSGYRSHVRLQKGCQRLSSPATLSYLTFGKCHIILASQCLPIEVGVVSIIVCNCGWIPIEAKRNVGPLWLVASDELPVVRIIVGTSRGSRLLQTVMYSHFGGYDTSVNRKSPEIRFFLKFSWAHSNPRAYGSRWLVFPMILGRGRGRLATTNIDMYGHFAECSNLQLIVNHLESGPFRHPELLHQRSNPHDYQFRWLCFLLSLACAAATRPSK